MRSLAVLLVAWLAAPAAARGPSAATPDQLFAEAKRLMEAGDYGEACLRFERSLALERALGTLLNLADCHEKAGRTASALREFADAAEWSQRVAEARREEVAHERAAHLDQRVARVRLVVSPRAAIESRRDGALVEPAGWSLEQRLDPGPHEFTVTAPGHRGYTTTITVPDGAATLAVEIPALEPIPVPVAAQDRPARRSWLLTSLALAAGGVALAGLISGSVYGARARSDWNSAQPDCHGGACGPTGLPLARRAKSEADLSTATITVGALAGTAAVALGVVAELRRRRQARSERVWWSPAITASGGALVVGGGF
jgi:hypothetical protein